MPLFHSNALYTAWAPSVAAGAAVALILLVVVSVFVIRGVVHMLGSPDDD